MSVTLSAPNYRMHLRLSQWTHHEMHQEGDVVIEIDENRLGDLVAKAWSRHDKQHHIANKAITVRIENLKKVKHDEPVEFDLSEASNDVSACAADLSQSGTGGSSRQMCGAAAQAHEAPQA